MGKIVPLDQPDAVCTLDQLSLQQEQQKHKPSDVERAIAQMTDDPQELHQTEKTKLEALLHEFADVLSVSDDDLGRTNIVKHQIDIGDATPVRQPPRRLPFHQRETVQQHVDKMLRNGIIEPSKGPWSSPVVLVEKKDGTRRFCVDFRKVNDLPRIDDTLDTLGGAQWFSTLDLASSYWQVEVDSADREKQPLPLLIVSINFVLCLSDYEQEHFNI